MSAIVTLIVWGGAFLWLGWQGLVVAFVATTVEYVGGRA